jgi:hypothetical protein
VAKAARRKETPQQRAVHRRAIRELRAISDAFSRTVSGTDFAKEASALERALAAPNPRVSRPTIARARAILIRSATSGEAACTFLSPRFTVDASTPQVLTSKVGETTLRLLSCALSRLSPPIFVRSFVFTRVGDFAPPDRSPKARRLAEGLREDACLMDCVAALARLASGLIAGQERRSSVRAISAASHSVRNQRFEFGPILTGWGYRSPIPR